MVNPDRAGENHKSAAPAEHELARATAELRKVTRRLTAETRERRRLEVALKALPNQIINAQDAERRRIAWELHDGVNQLLASVKFRLTHVGTQLVAASEPAQIVAQACEHLERALSELRRISHNLRPTELDDFGLATALQRLAQDFQGRGKMQIELKRNLPAKRFPKDVELAFYRIAQEALANVEEHSGASRVVVTLMAEADFATLNVRDDGKGIDKGKKVEADRGLGIVSMRERTNALGGVFSIESKPGRGTEISAHVKLTN